MGFYHQSVKAQIERALGYFTYVLRCTGHVGGIAEKGQFGVTAAEFHRYLPLGSVAVLYLVERREAAMNDTYLPDSLAIKPLESAYPQINVGIHGIFHKNGDVCIAKRLGNPVGSTVRLHARDEIADGTLAHGSDLIGQAARVPFVFLAILAIGFVAMLVAEAEARRREFAVLRAVGATRGQLAGRLALSAVKTALVGIVSGLPVGALAGWLCTFKTGNWPGLPHWFVLPVSVVAEGAFGALLFALLFAVPTALALVARSRRRGVV